MNNFSKLSSLIVAVIFVFSGKPISGTQKEIQEINIQIKYGQAKETASDTSWVDTPRVQLFSITPVNYTKGHEELEKMRTLAAKSNIDLTSCDTKSSIRAVITPILADITTDAAR
jgi:hypothetical protein